MNRGLVEHTILSYAILADGGFTITDVLPPGLTLALTAFTNISKELSEHEGTERPRLASVRIHGERAVRTLKCFTIRTNAILDNP